MDKKKRVSISIGNYQLIYGDREALRIAREIGADGVDFNLTRGQDYRKEGCVYALGEEAIRSYYRELRGYAEELGLEIVQTHGRISGLKNKPEEDEALLQNGRYDCIATAELGAPCCVMHTATTIHHGPNADPALMHEMNYRLFSSLLPCAAAENILLATETFGDAPKYGCIDFFGDIEEFVKGYERVKREAPHADRFCICMDPGHSNKATRFNRNPSPADVIRRLGSDIRVLHLNDNDTLTDQHKVPMTGCIDWTDLMDALDEIGYGGYYNMEINLKSFGEDFAVEYGRFAVKVMRQILKTRYGADCLT